MDIAAKLNELNKMNRWIGQLNEKHNQNCKTDLWYCVCEIADEYDYYQNQSEILTSNIESEFEKVEMTRGLFQNVLTSVLSSSSSPSIRED